MLGCTPTTTCDDMNDCTSGEVYDSGCICGGGVPMPCVSDSCMTRSCDGAGGCNEVLTGTCYQLTVFQDPADATPAGWTCVSCQNFDPYFERFIVGSATFGAVGGSVDHTHADVNVTFGATTRICKGNKHRPQHRRTTRAPRSRRQRRRRQQPAQLPQPQSHQV